MNDRGGRLARIACLVLAVLAAGAVGGQVLRCVAARLGGEIVYDRVGGGVVDHCVRVHRGLPIFAEPDETFVPWVYTPLYYHCAAAVMSFMGERTAACRVTALAFLALGVVVGGLVVRGVTGRWRDALWVLPLFLSQYAACRFFYDAPRVDQAAALWMVAAVAIACLGRHAMVGVGVGLALLLAFWSKQSTLAFSAVFLFLWLLADWRRSLIAGVTLAVTLSGSVAAVNSATDGWFWIFAFGLTPEHDIPLERVVGEFVEDWGSRQLPAFVLVLIGGVFVSVRRAVTPADRRLRLLWFGLLAAIAFTTLSRGRVGATPKVLMPAALLVSVFLPALGGWWSRRRPGRNALAAGGYLVLALILGHGWFDAAEAIPSEEDLADWRAAEQEFARHAARGPIWVAPWGFVTTRMEGQSMRPTLLALEDYIGTRGEATGHPIPPGLVRALEDQEFAAVFFPPRGERLIRPLLDEHYRMRDETLTLKVAAERKPVPLGVFVPRKRER